MSWRGAVKSFVSSGAFLSMIGGIGASGAYVVYTDSSRYPRMVSTFARGNILPPLAENDYEVAYAKRPALEATIKEILTPTFSNEYFIVQGPVGVGKTRLIVELTRQMIETRGSKNLGAPVYVLANQGRNFAETLGSAVNFYFDEHVSFRFFLDYVMRIHSMPNKDDDNRIVRVLDAIEKASFKYLTETGRPLVLIIDGLDDITRKSPAAVKLIQEKAKLWADTNSVKVVFVCNAEDTELLLQSNTSNWSRASSPISLSDLSKAESIEFLRSSSFMEKSKTSSTDNVSSKRTEGMTLELAEKVYDLVGGRIRHLITIKRDWLEGQEFDVIAENLMEREREKFVSVTNHSGAWKAIGLIRNFNNSDVGEGIAVANNSLKDNKLNASDKLAPVKILDSSKPTTVGTAIASTALNVAINSNYSNNSANNNNDGDYEGSSYLLSKLNKKTSPEVVRSLIKAGLLRCERHRLGVVVKFESRLTENVVNDLESTYRAEVSGLSEDS